MITIKNEDYVLYLTKYGLYQNEDAAKDIALSISTWWPQLSKDLRKAIHETIRKAPKPGTFKDLLDLPESDSDGIPSHAHFDDMITAILKKHYIHTLSADTPSKNCYGFICYRDDDKEDYFSTPKSNMERFYDRYPGMRNMNGAVARCTFAAKFLQNPKFEYFGELYAHLCTGTHDFEW